MSLSFSAATAQAEASAVATAIGSAPTIKLYTGTKPATPETAATGTLLATVPITGSFTASGGSITCADPASVTPVASGTPGYFRIATSGGTAIMDGTVGTSGADLNLSSSTISTSSPLDLGVATITFPVS